MPVPDPAILPGWPAVLHIEWAAAYVSLSPGSFRMHVVPDVPGIQLTPGRIGWARDDLDRWVAERRPHQAGSPQRNPWHPDP